MRASATQMNGRHRRRLSTGEYSGTFGRNRRYLVARVGHGEGPDSTLCSHSRPGELIDPPRPQAQRLKPAPEPPFVSTPADGRVDEEADLSHRIFQAVAGLPAGRCSARASNRAMTAA